MAYITNLLEPQVRLYNDPVNNKISDEEFNEAMHIDNSTMPKEISSEYRTMANTTKTKFNKKKNKPGYDFTTKNQSFLDLYNDLYKLGIKNNKFFLRLYDQTLKGVDPYSPVLPVDLQIRIHLECLINPWYWLREVCRIPQDGKPIEPGGGSRFLLDRNNVATWYLYLNGIKHYGSKPRQRGKTQDAIAKLNYAFHYGAMSSTALLFNKDQAAAKSNLYRFKCQRDMLPIWMQMRTAITEDGKIDKGTDSVLTVKNPVNGNMIKVMPKANSKEQAQRLGRGDTASFIYFDEVDFTNHFVEIWRSAAFAYNTASANAEKNKSVYGVVLTSTAGDLDTAAGKEATEFVNKMLPWKDEYLDKDIDNLKKILNSPAYNTFVFVEHSWRQLKCTLDWYEKACANVDYDEITILREIELKRISGSSQSPFKKNQILYLSRSQKKPIDSIDLSKNLSPINIYKKLNRDIPYILAVDTADGLGLDNNTFILINPYTQQADAEFKSPYISPPDFAKMIEKFMQMHCPRCMIVIESNKGREIISRLQEGPFREQIWYDADKLNSKIVEATNEYGENKYAMEAFQRRALGFATTPASRPKLFGVLENFMEERIEDIFTEYIVKDILGLVRKANGKIEAGNGNHDDCIMAYLIGLYVYFNASNLEEFGIVRGASEPTNYNADDKSEKGVLQKLKELLPSLPAELRQWFGEVTANKDPVKESFKYQETLQREMERFSANNEIPSAYRDPMDTGQYNQINSSDYMEDQIFKDQFDMFNDRQNDFNTDDWV